MSELEDFLNTTLPHQIEAEKALHNGDASPRFLTWSHQDPVTLFGAARTKSGWDELGPFFHQLASSFSNCTAYRFELVAAGVSGDLAYTVGYEYTSVSVDGAPIDPYKLRVTHIYRRENGEWKIVHRHADRPPLEKAQLSF